MIISSSSKCSRKSISPSWSSVFSSNTSYLFRSRSCPYSSPFSSSISSVTLLEPIYRFMLIKLISSSSLKSPNLQFNFTYFILILNLFINVYLALLIYNLQKYLYFILLNLFLLLFFKLNIHFANNIYQKYLYMKIDKNKRCKFHKKYSNDFSFCIDK